MEVTAESQQNQKIEFICNVFNVVAPHIPGTAPVAATVVVRTSVPFCFSALISKVSTCC